MKLVSISILNFITTLMSKLMPVTIFINIYMKNKEKRKFNNQKLKSKLGLRIFFQRTKLAYLLNGEKDKV